MPKAISGHRLPRTKITDEIRVASDLMRIGGDPSRLRILMLTEEAELHVEFLCEAIGLCQGSVSHHLAKMRLAGVVAARHEGRRVYYSPTKKGYLCLEAARKFADI
jgi:DNA-binding transcriptional ArsR family regulator